MDVGQMTIEDLEQLERRGGPEWEEAQRALAPMFSGFNDAIQRAVAQSAGKVLAPFQRAIAASIPQDFGIGLAEIALPEVKGLGVLRHLESTPPLDLDVLAPRHVEVELVGAHAPDPGIFDRTRIDVAASSQSNRHVWIAHSLTILAIVTAILIAIFD